MIRTAPSPSDRPTKKFGRNFFGRKFSAEIFSAENKFGRFVFRPKNFSAEKFAVRIAEGGNDGGGPGGSGAPPGPSVVRPPKVQKGKVHGTEMFRDKPFIICYVIILLCTYLL